MNDQIPQFCPTCHSTGVTSRVQLYQINFEEAAVMCENTECPFPFVSTTPCPLTVSRNVATLFATPQPPSSLTDGDSLASCSSASTWKSRTSTSTAISSTASTPPPRITSRKAVKPTGVNPRSVMSRVAQSLAATPRNFSAQSSPASSTVSVTDREVELFMRNSYASPNTNSATQLTPSPSPEVVSDATSQLFDDLDQLLTESLSQGSLAATEETDALISDFLNEFQATETRVEQPESRVQHVVSSSPTKKSVTRAQPSARKAALSKQPKPSTRITMQVTDSGATEFVIQPPVSKSVSKPATPKKRLRTTKKTDLRNDLNWVAETVSSKSRARAPVKVNSIVKRFLMNLPGRPASV